MQIAAMDTLVTVLEKTTSGDQNELKQAQQFLEQAAQSNLPQLIRTLSEVLYHGGNSAVCRQQAGVQLKNFLYTNDENLRSQYEERWLAMPEDVRLATKQNVLGALGTESFRPSAAAQCVQMIAVVELPRRLWPGLITTLVQNVTNPASTEMMKESTLQAIGYICQDVEHRWMEESANEILTAIVHGMRRDEPSIQVRLAATTALFNSLELVRDDERNYIMQVVVEASQSRDDQVKAASHECLLKIIYFYYQLVPVKSVPRSPLSFISNGSPLKEFPDSPLTRLFSRQTAKHNKQLGETNRELWETEEKLIRERMDKHFLIEENSRLKQERKRLEPENCDLKIKVKELSEARMNESTGNTNDTSDMYHNLLKEYKEHEKYLGSVQHQLLQVLEENSVLQAKLDGFAEKLASATEQKISAELSLGDMKTNLTEAQDENTCLSNNVEELKREIKDINWQIQNSIQFSSNNFSTGMKSFAPYMPSVHLTADMTGISMDADDSISALGALGDISENLGDVVGRQQQERIDDLEREKVKLDEQIVNDQKKINEVETDLECKKEIIEQLSNSVKNLNEEKDKMLESYEAEKRQLGSEVDGLRSEVEALKEKLREETETANRTIGDTGLQELETLRDELETNTSMELELEPTDDRIMESPEVSINNFSTGMKSLTEARRRRKLAARTRTEMTSFTTRGLPATTSLILSNLIETSSIRAVYSRARRNV